MGFTCPATTVVTVVSRALDRVRERALGFLCLSITQIPARQAQRGVPDLPPGSLTGGALTDQFLPRLRDGHYHCAMGGTKYAPVGERAAKS